MSGFIRGAIYDGDVPLAERRAQALSIDHEQLKSLLGDSAMRELLDDDVIAAVESLLQQRDAGYGVKHEDGLHDLLLRLGDLRLDEIEARTREGVSATGLVDALVAARRAVWVRVAGEARVVSAYIEGMSRVLNQLAKVLPDISRFAAIEDLEQGITISRSTLLQPLSVLATFGLPMLVLSYVFLRNKEVAP